MASNVTFTEKATTLYGAKQTGGFGVPETLTSVNAIAAVTATSDPNISVTEEQMMGDTQSCEVLVTPTDIYQEVKAESVIPRLGSLFGRQLDVYESALLKFDSNISGTPRVVTFTAATDVVNLVRHNLINGTVVSFPSIVTTTGISINTTYFIRDVTTNTFKLAATLGGAILPLTGDGTGSLANTIVFAGVTMTVTVAATTTQLAQELSVYLNDLTATQAHTTFTGTPDVLYNYYVSGATIVATAEAANVDEPNLTVSGSRYPQTTLTPRSANLGNRVSFPFEVNMNASGFASTIIEGYSISAVLKTRYENTEDKLQEATTVVNLAESAFLNAERVAKKLNLLNLGTAGDAAVDALISNLASIRVQTALILSQTKTSLEALQLLKFNLKQELTFDNTGASLVTQLKLDSQAAKNAVFLIDLTTVGTLSDPTLLDALENTNTLIQEEYATLSFKLQDFYLQGNTKVEELPAIVTVNTPSARSQVSSANATVVAVGYTVASLFPVLVAVEFSNETPPTDSLTLQYRQSSLQLDGTQKTTIITDAIASADLTIEVGQRPKMAFNFMGNLYDVVNITSLANPIAQQMQDSSYVTKAESIRNASLQAFGAGLTLNNICFSKLSVSNVDRFERQRVLTGCGDTWDIAAKYGTATITILEPEANTNIATQFNTEDSVGKEFWFNFKQDGTSGNTLEVTLTKLTLKGYKRTAVNNRAAFDLDFTYSGFANIVLK